MDIIKGILGEQDEEPKKDKKEEPKKAPKSEPAEHSDRGERGGTPEDSEVDELANLWTTGNKNEVANRFMGMDNETAVKVVFAVGRDGALELARMVDLMLEQSSTGDDESQEDSTEPAAVQEPNNIRDILGGSPEGEEAHLRQFRQDRAASPEGEMVRQRLKA